MAGVTQVRSINDLEKKLSENVILWDEIAPTQIREWMDVFSQSHGGNKELLLINILASVSALIGDTTVKVLIRGKNMEIYF